MNSLDVVDAFGAAWGVPTAADMGDGLQYGRSGGPSSTT